jgi:hypothetical protein
MATKKHRVELRAGVNSGQFQAGGQHVELTADSPTFETDDPNLFASLCQLPFLKPATQKES